MRSRGVGDVYKRQVQYFVGDFDGLTFTSDNDKDAILWADWGADFYAPQSWSEAPDGRRLWLAWLNNWAYAQDIPTSTWRGSFSVPRELALVTTADGVRLTQQPIACLLYTSPSPRDRTRSRMPSSA